MSQSRSSKQLAVIAFAGNLIFCALVGGSLLVLRSPDDSASAAEPGPAPTRTSASPTSAPSSPKSEAPPSTPPAASVAPTRPGAPKGFQPASGPGGLTTLIPAGWRAAVRSTGTDAQATDPRQPTSFLRYGGSPSPNRPLISALHDAESDFIARYPSYQRVGLTPTTWHGYEAVGWEFEFDGVGGRKHVNSVYWRARGNDYLLYASSLVTDWPRMQAIYTTASAATKP